MYANKTLCHLTEGHLVGERGAKSAAVYGRERQQQQQEQPRRLSFVSCFVFNV